MFHNFYRPSIYRLIHFVENYINYCYRLENCFCDDDDVNHIAISGGDGLSNNLLSVERIVTPDTDVKAILKITNGEDWREKYVFVELHIERAVDYMVHCLNGNPRYEIEYCEGIQNEEWWLEPDKIRELFYEEKLKGVFEFKICNNDNFINPEKKTEKERGVVLELLKSSIMFLGSY